VRKGQTGAGEEGGVEDRLFKDRFDQ